MATYMTRPSTTWPGYADIIIDGILSWTVPPPRVDETIAYDADHTRQFFQRIVDRKAAGDLKLVVADGHAYSIGSAHDNPKGFGGTLWRIQFHDGRIVRTDSLWHLGDVPDDWREQLPDNATLKEVSR